MKEIQTISQIISQTEIQTISQTETQTELSLQTSLTAKTRATISQTETLIRILKETVIADSFRYKKRQFLKLSFFIILFPYPRIQNI